MASGQKQSQDFKDYETGETQSRPWGNYTVTGLGTLENGESYCDKDIVVDPGQILSLQSHKLRREVWTVKSGTLTVILDDRKMDLQEGQSVEIPQGAVHCMANKFDTPVTVAERQKGQCYEEDILRFADAYGRGSDTADNIEESLKLYNELREEINNNG